MSVFVVKDRRTPTELEQFFASQVAISGHGALNPVPPDFEFHTTAPKDDRNSQVAHDATAVIEPQVVEGIICLTEFLVIVTEQRNLELATPAWVPMQRHHERQIACADVDVPDLPIE